MARDLDGGDFGVGGDGAHEGVTVDGEGRLLGGGVVEEASDARLAGSGDAADDDGLGVRDGRIDEDQSEERGETDEAGGGDQCGPAAREAWAAPELRGELQEASTSSGE